MLKLIVVAVVIAMAAGQADRYPAGLNPALCPNYPYCDNRILATYASAPVAPVARSYPAGVHPATCPNYPYCGSSAPLPYNSLYTREYPAGVSPAACPNYPYCH